MKNYRRGLLGVCGILAIVCAISALGRRDSFAVTFLYVACTLLVGGTATVVTIRGIAGPARGKGGRRPVAGSFETGLLIGLFVVAPLALSGAFALLEALVGSP
jgi:hypothetical protein